MPPSIFSFALKSFFVEKLIIIMIEIGLNSIYRK